MSLRRFWDLTKVLFPQDNWVQDLTPLKDTESTFETTPVMLSNFGFTDKYSLIESSVCGSENSLYRHFI